MAFLSDNIRRLISYWQVQNPQINVNRGTIVYQLISAFAASMTDTQTQIEGTVGQSFLTTATGQFLTQKASDYGVQRTLATAATGTFIFTRQTADPNNSYTQSAGTTVQTTSGAGTIVSFTTLSDGTIAAGQTSSPPVNIVATIAGSSGNVGTGTVTTILAQNPGISGGYNPGPTTGGADEESDTDLLVATLAAIQPSNSIYAIQGAARQVSGVFAAAVLDWQDGLGNYTCYVSDSSGNTNGTMISNVTSAIAKVDGIGLTRHVQGLTLVTQSIYANVFVPSSYQYSSVVTNLATTINNYINSLGAGQSLVPYTLYGVVDGSVGNFGPVVGVADFEITSPTSTVVVGPYSILRLPGNWTSNTNTYFTQISN